MNKASWLCMAAMLAYSLELAVADLKLGKVHPRVLTFLYGSGILVGAATLIFWTMKEQWTLPTIVPWAALLAIVGVWAVMVNAGKPHLPDEITWPQGTEWAWIAGMIVCSFIGAFAHFAALNAHAGALKLSMFYMLLPVCSSIPALCLKGEVPSLKTVIAWVLAGIAIWLAKDQSPN